MTTMECGARHDTSEESLMCYLPIGHSMTYGHRARHGVGEATWWHPDARLPRSRYPDHREKRWKQAPSQLLREPTPIEKWAAERDPT
jgi:hypothetical protein